MAENKFCFSQNMNSSCKETVCIDCNRVLDSCRDKDCFEDTRVYLTDFGQEIIERTGSIRVKNTKIISTGILVDPIQFNRGFYQVTVRFYVKLIMEACICLGKLQELEGIAVCEKKVILYGSEGCVNIFKSDTNSTSFCGFPNCNEISYSNRPIAVCEVIDPIALDICIKEKTEKCCCCNSVEEIPEYVCNCVNGSLSDYADDGKKLFTTLGFFSVIRIERPAQYLISATEYSVPDKECVTSCDDDPCTLFSKMAFPINEFSPPSFRQLVGEDKNNNCGC
ncbi:MAG: hypothetical protein IJA85_11500 [Clostridia bacterium]|nr:hypothetical protein [Clostridia bacterium]